MSTSENGTVGINKIWVFAIIATALLMNTIDSTIVATALHTLQMELNTTVNLAGWTMTAYSFGFVMLLPLSAKLCMRYGSKRMFLLSVTLFTITSFLCSLSGDIYTLIVMRLLQGIGGSAVTPSATSLIVNHFGTSRDKYLGLFGSFFSIGAMIGPVFGGFFVKYMTWQWIFYINIPFGLAILFFARKAIPSDRRDRLVKQKLDVTGMMLLAVALFLAMLFSTGMSSGDSTGSAFFFYLLPVLSVVFFLLFFRHIRQVDVPFIKPSIIYGKGFGAVNTLNFIHAGMVMGAVALIPLFAINNYGFDEMQAGVLLIAQGVAAVVLSVLMSINLGRMGYKLPLFVGAMIQIVGIAMLAFEPIGGIGVFAWLSVSTALIGTGSGIMSPAARNAGIQLAPAESANIAAIRSLALQMGQIVSITLATAFITVSTEPIKTHALVYLILAACLLLTVPAVAAVPENKPAR